MDEKERAEILERTAEYGSSLVNRGCRTRSAIPKALGLCSSCKSVVYIRTRLMDEVFWCNRFAEPRRLHVSDPVEVCSKYWNVSWEDIWDMKEHAMFINLDKKNIGFK